MRTSVVKIILSIVSVLFLSACGSGNKTIDEGTDSIAPTTPSNLNAVAKSSGSIELTWSVSNDNVGVAGYKVYRSSVEIGSSTIASYTDSSLNPNTIYCYTVKAYDAKGNLSNAQTESCAKTSEIISHSDASAPSSPSNLIATALSNNRIDLKWTASTDDVGVAGYKIFRGNEEIGSSVTTTYSDTNLDPITSYCYSVKAYDAVGNISHGQPDECTKTFNSIQNGIPQFVDKNYIELDKIHRISKFRSGIGHDYSDNFESCRSMKHYFEPDSISNWSQVKIFSPVNGSVSSLYLEGMGAQVDIKSTIYPDITFTIFHVRLSTSLNIGDKVAAGQELGTHYGSLTMSDIAVRVGTQDGKFVLISYFDLLTGQLFQAYQARGVNSRGDLIISKEGRNADPLSCNGEIFANGGKIVNWVNLK